LPARQLEPAVAFWREQGFTNAAAIALSRAGIHAIEDLARWDRDSLESLHWIGRTELRRCEALLGRPLPARRDYWTERGLSPRIASGLIAAGIHTLDDFARLTREEFLLRQGLARTALEKCEELLGRRLPSPEEEWRRRGCKTRSLARKLTLAGILTEEDLRRKTAEELAAAGLDRGEAAFCRRLVKPKRTARGGRPTSPGGA
jgi:predicted flap endonuclease-1-like 5' DNA nuclease